MNTDIGGYGQRYDAHIGESMMIYPVKLVNNKMSFTPYILGGFCGDYTKTQTNLFYDDVLGEYRTEKKDRWSFATQLGLGTHFNLTERFDFSFTGQYMIHFGSDIDAVIQTNRLGEKYLQINEGKDNVLEGHLLFTLSANYVIADFRKHK